ncbi:MAG TPA: SDR family oxidoreductase [Candidatus Limnocylindrales bacterium]|nr:SDR family oxidoreductase [Candidatus Limnocylindrales bacterium]
MEGHNPSDFGDRVVLVTGGTRGIGAAIALCFRRANAIVVAAGRADADVRDPSQVDRLITTVVERHGRLDVVVNNAGGTPYAEAATASPRLHAAVIALNLVAPLHVAQAANAVMQKQAGGGSIIMIGSVSGTRPSPGTAAYGAAKAGLHHLATSLAVEWAPLVRVNSLIVGLVATPAAVEHYGENLEQVSRSIPMGRMATPDDVAQACLYLASPQSAYISGASLAVHGGGERPAYLAFLNRPEVPS